MAKDEEQLEGPITINIGNVCGGAMLQAFDLAMVEILANIADPNTEARKKRHITLDLMIQPKDDRTQLDTEFSCTVKTAPMMPMQSRMYVGKDKEGTLYALTEDPRQLNIFTPPKPIEVAAPIEFKSAKK